MMSELDNLFIEFIESLTDRTQSIRCYGDIKHFLGQHEKEISSLSKSELKKLNAIMKVLETFEETDDFKTIMSSIYAYIDTMTDSNVSKRLKEIIEQ